MPKWPLPRVNLPHLRSRPKEWFPELEVLVDLALQNGDSEAVVKWLDEAERLKRQAPRELRAADAIAETHPDRAIDIWKRKADAEIATVKPRGYIEAGRYLRRIRATLETDGRKDEWDALLARLKEANRRRPRCMEVLDGLEGKPIIEG